MSQLTCEKCQKTFATRPGWKYHTSHSVCDAKPSEPSTEEEKKQQEEKEKQQEKEDAQAKVDKVSSK